MSKQLINYFQLIFIVFVFSWVWQASATEAEFELPYMSNSPGPGDGHPGLVELDQQKSLRARIMRVLVFPHTLKNDGRHGIPDDSKEVTFVSSKIMTLEGDSGLSMQSTRFVMKIHEGDFIIETGEGELGLEPENLKLKGIEPVLVERKKNVDKSHHYLGTFEIIKNEDKINVINLVDIETYLRGVVPSESIDSWPIEALKAQAVAARTYALYHYSTAPGTRFYHVDDTARFQVYTGLTHVTGSTDQAVNETDSEVMLFNGKVIIAYFHSYSGGRTDSAENIFLQKDAPYCKGNEEVFTREELKAELPPKAHWIVEWTTDLWTPEFLIQKFKESDSTRGRFSTFDDDKGLDFKVLDWNYDFGSLKKIEATQVDKSVELYFTEIRKAVGWTKFPSYHFRLLKENDGFQFKGNGWGHHVGMSQWGAMMMAKHKNADHVAILKHYYFGIDIQKL